MAKNDDDRDHEVGRKAAEIEVAARRAQRYRKMDYWRPYPRQAEFFAATRHHREVGLFAATQVGKSEAAAFKVACDLTGLYPKFWKGRRFGDATKAMGLDDVPPAKDDLDDQTFRINFEIVRLLIQPNKVQSLALKRCAPRLRRWRVRRHSAWPYSACRSRTHRRGFSRA
jgi:hypothetical protein